MVGHWGSSHGTAIALAERLPRAVDRVNPSRMFGSWDRLQPSGSTAYLEVVFRILRADENSFVSGQGRSPPPAHANCSSRPNRGSLASGWIASSLRARCRLSSPSPCSPHLTLVSHLLARRTTLRPRAAKVPHKSHCSESRWTFSWPMQQRIEFSVGTTRRKCETGPFLLAKIDVAERGDSKTRRRKHPGRKSRFIAPFFARYYH